MHAAADVLQIHWSADLVVFVGTAHSRVPYPKTRTPPEMVAHDGAKMAKEGIHPPYHPVVFKDASSGALVLTRSTMTSSTTVKLEDGNEYPMILLEITSDSHPFYTGTQRLIDTQGRVDKFKKRYGR